MVTDRVNIIVTLKKLGTQGLNVLQKGFDRLKRSAIFVGKALLGMAAAGTAAAFAFSRLVRRGGEVINVQRAFARMTGNATASIRTLRTATQGLIRDLDLMVGFNRAVTLGSAQNVEQFAELAKTAITLGRALKVDAAFALESLSLGIGRQSRLILDNLGLIVSIEGANKRYAAQLGKTTKELTEVERREAFRTAALEAARAKIEELGGVELNAADALKRLTVAFSNFIDGIASKLAGSAPLTEFLTRVANIVDDIVDVLNSGDVRGAFAALGTIAGNAFAVAFLEAMKLVERGFRALAAKLRRDHPFFFGPTTTTRVGRALGIGGFGDTPGVSQRPGAQPIPVSGPTSLLDRLISERLAAIVDAERKLAAAATSAAAAAEKLDQSGKRVAAAIAPRVIGALPPGGLAPITARGPRPRFPGGAPQQALSPAQQLAQQAMTNVVFKEWIDLQEFARGVIQSTLTPQERYTQEVGRYQLAASLGLLTAEQYRRAIETLDQSMQKASISAEQLATAAIQSFSAIIQAIIGGRGAGGIFGGLLGTIGGIVGIANPLAGAALGGLGGIITGLSGRGDKPKIVVDAFGARAEGQLQSTLTGLQRVELTIIDPRTGDARTLVQEINALQARDGVARIPVVFG